jgi:hypothetical protein
MLHWRRAILNPIDRGQGAGASRSVKMRQKKNLTSYLGMTA